MKLRKNDAEDVALDETSVLQHYPPDEASFSLSVLDIDGTHERQPDKEIAYYVLGGDGHIHLENHIMDLDEGDVLYLGEQRHELEGDLRVLAVTAPPETDPGQL